MRLFIALVAATAAIAGATCSARAQTSCTTVGNVTYCSGPGGSYSCTRVGNTTYCS